MGSVRQANWRGFVPFLALNVLVSALTALLVLAIWDPGEPAANLPPTPTFDVAARVASAVPTKTATIPPSPTPVTYTVKGGDTLGAIAAELGLPVEALMAANGLTDPDTLSAGQVLIVPELETPAPGSSPVGPRLGASATPTPAEQPAAVVIKGAYERGALATEFVYLENTGGVANMLGWSLDDGEGNVYRFPSFTLYREGGVNVYTRAGEDSVINLYWGMDRALWEPGKVITLKDAAGQVQSNFQIPGG